MAKLRFVQHPYCKLLIINLVSDVITGELECAGRLVFMDEDESFHISCISVLKGIISYVYIKN